jgi:hypothetical protein
MAGPKRWTETLIAERVKAGRGQGIGADYSPWLYVQEFSSRGTQTRVPGFKLKRTLHMFSYLERGFFLVAEFQPNFLDWNEQYPIDRGITLGASTKLGIRHPAYPRTHVPVVMTLDAVHSTVDANGEVHVAALDFKPQRRLSDERTLAKLSLHRAACAHMGIEHGVYTEESISWQIVRNIDWVRTAVPRDGELTTVPGLFTDHLVQFEEGLLSCRKRPSVNQFCMQYDKAHQVEPGTGLRLFKLLVWNHRISVNLDAKRLERELVPRRDERFALPVPRRIA